ncbi:hypothetical protein [Burkholderia multivorans]|uniref:hypothetical protein n=1 Tax=Burkholderia multivorans TaxID=87883 RepID=UPI003BAF0B94
MLPLGHFQRAADNVQYRLPNGRAYYLFFFDNHVFDRIRRVWSDAQKGTNFKVQWTYYDADDWRPGEQVKKQQAEANASLAPTNVPDAIGSRILGIHFYPDHHVELAFSGEMLGSTRLPIVDVSRELTKRYGKQLDEKRGQRCPTASPNFADGRGSVAQVPLHRSR